MTEGAIWALLAVVTGFGLAAALYLLRKAGVL